MNFKLIKAIVCDQASNFVRLCKQFDFLELGDDSEEEEDSESEEDESNENMIVSQKALYNVPDPFTFVDNFLDKIREEVNTIEKGSTARIDGEISSENEDESSSCESDDFLSNEEDDELENGWSSEEENEYQSKKRFEIEIKSDKLPRFSCANHKLNLAVRRAIENNQSISSELKQLNKFVKKVRRSHNMNRIFSKLQVQITL